MRKLLSHRISPQKRPLGTVAGGAKSAGSRENKTAPRFRQGKSRHRNPLNGRAYVHTAVDDPSWVAYAQIHGDETPATAVGLLKRAVSWFAARGVPVECPLRQQIGL